MGADSSTACFHLSARPVAVRAFARSLPANEPSRKYLVDYHAVLSPKLEQWVRWVRLHAPTVLALCVAGTLGSAFYAGTHLGINSDTIQLFPEHLPARQNHDAFVALFPDLENALLIVVDAKTPEASRDAATALILALRRDPTNFEDAYLPTGGDFFETHALLYQDIDELESFGDRLIQAQPIIAELERDASLANLATLIDQGLEQFGMELDANSPMVREILDRIGEASVEIYREHPVATSWESLLIEGSAIDVVTRRVVLAHPVLDWSDALPARAPLAAVHKLRSDIESASGGTVQVRVTGNPALTHEETLNLVWDLGVSGVLCLSLVSIILLVALRSSRLSLAVVTTLLVGLVWTAGFAAIAVENLNVISVAAGVLFLGLGVDFGLHLAMRYADLLGGGNDHATALDASARSVGASLVICTATTAIGFFAFLPTDYQGVAELGLITGTGLFIILFLTLTLLPALLTTVFRIDPSQLADRSLRFGDAPSRWITQHAAGIRVTAALLFLASLALLPSLRFDANIVAMRDPSTESVQTFNDLLADAGTTSPWYANSVVANLEQADALTLRMRALPEVSRSISLSDYVPAEQEAKLEILGDISFLMGPSHSGEVLVRKNRSEDEQVDAVRKLRALLESALGTDLESPMAVSIRDLISKLDDFLFRIEGEIEPSIAVAKLNEVLLASLPDQIHRLKRGLEAQPIHLDNLPPRLVHRLVAPDGRARVQTFPAENLENHEAFTRFVDAVQRVDPNATGIAVNLVEFARTTKLAFRQAIATALIVIAVILWVLWRRLGDLLLVLAPLTLAGAATGAIMVALGQPLNFFNVVVIPLLLGAGVDSGIHLVEQARARKPGEGEVLGTTTARAVLFSALTTITSFGSLALSSHVGLAGLGILLSVGMSLTAVGNLVVLPALLARRWQISKDT